MMSERGKQLQRSIAMTLVLLAEHDKLYPHEVDELLRMLLAHVRSSRAHLLLDRGAL